MRLLNCPGCGAPITPPSHAVRVVCSHCNATVDVTSEGVAQLAQLLNRAGISVSANPMTRADIEANIAQRMALEASKRRHAIIVTCAAFGVLGVIALLVILASR